MLPWNSDDINITPRERADAADVLDQSWNPGDLHTFIKITGLPISLFMAKYPVTNAQYARFLQPENFTNPTLWNVFPQFYRKDKTDVGIHLSDNTAWQWLQKELQNKNNPVENGVLYPRYWRDGRLGVGRPSAPVVDVTWWEANAYCKWLLMNWDELEEGQHGLPKPKQVRLPTESEWTLAAGGEYPENRYAWDAPGQATTGLNEILQRANIAESNIPRTTPVWMYPLGASPYGVMDMTGNINEWQANFLYEYVIYEIQEKTFGLRGGSWSDNHDYARVSRHFNFLPGSRVPSVGFRVVALPE